MLEKVSQLFIGIFLILMGVEAFFLKGYWSRHWGRYISYAPFPRVIGVILLIGGFFILGFALFSRLKRQFLSVKKKYGIAKDKPYDIESMTHLLLRFNQMVDTPLSFDDYTVIRLDGKPIPILYGNVAYASSSFYGIRTDSRTAVYSIIEDDEISKVAQKHEDLFKLAMQKEGTTVFRIQDLKKLGFYLREQKRQNSASDSKLPNFSQ